jgi:hypothetical protein
VRSALTISALFAIVAIALIRAAVGPHDRVASVLVAVFFVIVGTTWLVLSRLMDDQDPRP